MGILTKMEANNTNIQTETTNIDNSYQGNKNYRGRGGNYKKTGNSYNNKNNGYNNNYNKGGNNQRNNYNRNQYTQKVDPAIAQAMIVRAEMYILCKYPYLIETNKKNEDLGTTIPENSQFFVIKSFSE